MIRSYTMSELEQFTGVNKRTISDYVTKGLLSGPSHRGRGAVYSQRDFNVLRVIPKLRSLLKDEYGSLKSIAAFLTQLSVPDIQALASRDTERAFTVEVRRLRVRLSLIGMMPHVSPEKFDEVLSRLTPEQICSVDAGRVQIGAVIDLAKLFALDQEISSAGFSTPEKAREDTDCLPELSAELLAIRDLEETIPSRSEIPETNVAAENSDTKTMLTLKLEEIADRLDRVEQMLDHRVES